jgi:hypothetical protein
MPSRRNALVLPKKSQKGAIPMILSRGIRAESRISRYVAALSIDSKLTGYNSALGA